MPRKWSPGNFGGEEPGAERGSFLWDPRLPRILLPTPSTAPGQEILCPSRAQQWRVRPVLRSVFLQVLARKRFFLLFMSSAGGSAMASTSEEQSSAEEPNHFVSMALETPHQLRAIETSFLLSLPKMMYSRWCNVKCSCRV